MGKVIGSVSWSDPHPLRQPSLHTFWTLSVPRRCRDSGSLHSQSAADLCAATCSRLWWTPSKLSPSCLCTDAREPYTLPL